MQHFYLAKIREYVFNVGHLPVLLPIVLNIALLQNNRNYKKIVHFLLIRTLQKIHKGYTLFLEFKNLLHIMCSKFR